MLAEVGTATANSTADDILVEKNHFVRLGNFKVDIPYYSITDVLKCVLLCLKTKKTNVKFEEVS